MKVLLINGSPRKNGNTALALREMEQVFRQEGVEVVTVMQSNPSSQTNKSQLWVKSSKALPTANRDR